MHAYTFVIEQVVKGRKRQTKEIIEAPSSIDAESKIRLKRGQKIVDVSRTKPATEEDRGLGTPNFKRTIYK